MTFTPVESVFGGVALALALYWYAHLLPNTSDGPPSFHTAMCAHPLAVAFVAGQISVGIVLSRFMPSAFDPPPFAALPLARLVLASALLAAGLTVANACVVPHLSLLTTPSMSALLFALCALVASVTATLLSSARFYMPLDGSSPPLWHAPIHGFPARRALVALCAVPLACAALPPLLARVQPHPSALLLEALSYVVGACVAAALVTSGALHPAKLLGVLDLEADLWDPSLGVFILAALIMSALLPPHPDPKLLSDPEPSPFSHIRAHINCTDACCDVCVRAVVGAVLCGVGCGLAGVSPHCALVYFGAFPARVESVAVVLSMVGTTALCSVILSVLDKRGVECAELDAVWRV